MNNHTHTWKPESFTYNQKQTQISTGNFICDCGEILWQDEILDIVSMYKGMYGIRGNSPFHSANFPSLHVTQAELDKIVDRMSEEDWESDGDGNEYPIQKITPSGLESEIEKIIMKLLGVV